MGIFVRLVEILRGDSGVLDRRDFIGFFGFRSFRVFFLIILRI